MTCKMSMVSFVALVFLVSGCGGNNEKGPKRYPLSGKVTYKGEPLAKGTITFGAVDATKGTAASATITAGSYTVEKGLAEADYIVTVEASGHGAAEDRAKKMDSKPLVPVKYSDPKQTDLKLTMTKSTKSKDFELVD